MPPPPYPYGIQVVDALRPMLVGNTACTYVWEHLRIRA